MKSKVYTLTGDKGTTSLVGGQRVAKDDIRVEAYGTVDELNAHIGQVVNAIKGTMPEVENLLFKVQNKLFNVGAYLATEQTDDQAPVYGLQDDDVKAIEAMIDTLDAQLPPMRGFILPGGSNASVLCDVCRTVTRRAERRVVTLAQEKPLNPLAQRYLNRLSDFFFILARHCNVSSGVEEVLWDRSV